MWYGERNREGDQTQVGLWVSPEDPRPQRKLLKGAKFSWPQGEKAQKARVSGEGWGGLGRNQSQGREGQGLSSPLADCHHVLPSGPPLRAAGPAAGVSRSRAEVAASCRGGCGGGPKERGAAPPAALAGEAAPRGGREKAWQ